jgi:urate oxidase
MKLIHNSYGKGRVRVGKVVREGDWHTFIEYTVHIHLEGDLETAYTEADNSLVYPTDTMKNSVYAVASQHDLASPETFALALSQHFLDSAAQMTQAKVLVDARPWKRMAFGEQPHPHSFIGASGERRTAEATRTRTAVQLVAGLKDLPILKTTQSAFTGFWRDQYTTLPEESDRLLGTNLSATWEYGAAEPVAYNEAWTAVRQTLLHTFAHHQSESVQHTLYDMGKAVLEGHSAVAEIYLAMPNVHNIPFDLSRLGLANNSEIFVPIDEPHGLIEGRMVR